MRVVPDVAAVGDPETGLAIVFQGAVEVIGGTSLACPVFAGIQALASQHRRFPIGFANPLLYVLGLGRHVFHDVTAPAQPTAMMTQSGSHPAHHGPGLLADLDQGLRRHHRPRNAHWNSVVG